MNLEISLKEEIEREIPLLVEILKDEVPSLNEIRLFGSYNRKDWHPKFSDVDIFVETNDEFYSVNKDTQKIPPGGFHPYGAIAESRQRKDIRRRVSDKTEYFKGNYSFHILSE